MDAIETQQSRHTHLTSLTYSSTNFIITTTSFNHNHTCYFKFVHDIQFLFMLQITLYMHMLHFSTGRTIVPDVTDLMDRTWRLSDGSSMFLSCRPGQPSNGFEYCVMWLDDGTQNDIKRNALIPFVCKRQLNIHNFQRTLEV